ncbi:MAG: SurA N-terminal domain-containing protein, partial [Bdellovibrionales bacterium]|nr:SurA N-terminal domain-containing protein [Bdellovibrionales bacterium]
MIQFFHRYRNSVLAILVVSLVCLVMTGFGIDLMRSGNQSGYAIKVNDNEISTQDFYQQRRNIIDNYRRNLGEAFGQFERQLTANLNQELVDNLISGAVLEEFARDLNLYVGDEEVRDTIVNQLFRGQFDPLQYQAFLRESGMSAQGFEEKIKSEALQDALLSLVQDTTQASEAEARTLYERENTNYSVKYLTFDPESFRSKVEDPSDETLKSLYEENAAELEEPARV